jgi:hypothetical protein
MFYGGLQLGGLVAMVFSAAAGFGVNREENTESP